jgi:hypothetical protein
MAVAKEGASQPTSEFVRDYTCSGYLMLKKMSNDDKLELHGTGRRAYYTLKRANKNT